MTIAARRCRVNIVSANINLADTILGDHTPMLSGKAPNRCLLLRLVLGDPGECHAMD